MSFLFLKKYRLGPLNHIDILQVLSPVYAAEAYYRRDN